MGSIRSPISPRRPRARGASKRNTASQAATWRFRNEGNRAAFVDNPEVYAPQFGGYDPVAIARGTSVPGHPQVWLVTGQRLYLFYSKEARAEFASQAQSLLSLAERRWPEVQRSLP